MATLWFVEEILTFAQENAGEIRRRVDEAASESVVGQTLATRATFAQSDEEVTILLGEVAEERHPQTGEIILRRLDTVTPTRMHEYGTFEASETEVAPDVYSVLPEAADALERLMAHGVAVVPAPEGEQLRVERFLIESSTTAARPFQGRVERTITGSWEATAEVLPPGTMAVPVDQPLGRLAFSLLEPRSDDGFTNWAILDDAIEAGNYPILRSR